MPYSIMMDAGHGGRDPGAVYNGRQEKDDTLRLALAVGEILQDRGIDVEYTRTTDVYETPYEKAMEANQAGADLFISIHRNSFPTDNEVSGVESLVYDLSGLKLEIAEAINEEAGYGGFCGPGREGKGPILWCLKGPGCRLCWWRQALSIRIQTTCCLTRALTISRWPSRTGYWTPCSGTALWKKVSRPVRTTVYRPALSEAEPTRSA